MSDAPIYDLKNGKPHPFHILHPSAWPLLGALAAGALAVGALVYMHAPAAWREMGIGWTALILGFMAVIAVMWGWWRDVIYEGYVEKAHSEEVRTGLRWGMALFIASEVMFFFAFFWVFFGSSLFPKEAIGFTWPPKDITPIKPFDLPLLMTMVLLLSGCAVTWAHHEILENKKDEVIKALAIAVGLGVIFTILQVYEYHHADFPFQGGIFASTFYMTTGFHGFHVIVGTIFLAVCLYRARKKHFTIKGHVGFESAAWYWHFVDVVWLFLFAAMYWWGGA